MLHIAALVLAHALGLLGSFLTCLLLLMSGANATPAAIGQIKLMSAAVVLVQLGAAVLSAMLYLNDRPWLAVFAGLAPAAFAITLVSILVYLEW